MDILGLEPVMAGILITAVGIALSVLLGWLKSTEVFNVRQTVASVIIGFVISAQVVITQLGLIPIEITSTELGVLLFALIAQVAGIDSLAKSAAKAVARARTK